MRILLRFEFVWLLPAAVPGNPVSLARNKGSFRAEYERPLRDASTVMRIVPNSPGPSRCLFGGIHESLLPSRRQKEPVSVWARRKRQRPTSLSIAGPQGSWCPCEKSPHSKNRRGIQFGSADLRPTCTHRSL